MDIKKIQTELKIRGIDGWLFYDFQNRDSIAYSILGLENKHTSRRWFYFIPQKGEPIRLVSKVEPKRLETLPGKKYYYLSWEEQHKMIGKILGKPKKIAMQYSPKNNIPYISLIDAGLIELIKSFKHKIISSADLVTIFESIINEKGYELHISTGKIIDKIRHEAFLFIENSLRNNIELTEYQVQQFIVQKFNENNLVTSSHPIVGVNDHPADPHFEPTERNSYKIKKGDTLLIDLWAKMNVENGIYYDITWVGFTGTTPPEEYVKIFNIVKNARDYAVEFIKEKFAKNEKCFGWQVDDACRSVIKKAGYGKYFIHRTGHSIGTEVHGNGPNIDNLETKDERELLPGCLFSIEPGIYLDGKMAVRSEFNVMIKGNKEVMVTGEKQMDLVLMNL